MTMHQRQNFGLSPASEVQKPAPKSAEVAQRIDQASLRFHHVKGILQGISWIAMDSESRNISDIEDTITSLVAGAISILDSGQDNLEDIVKEIHRSGQSVGAQ